MEVSKVEGRGEDEHLPGAGSSPWKDTEVARSRANARHLDIFCGWVCRAMVERREMKLLEYTI